MSTLSWMCSGGGGGVPRGAPGAVSQWNGEPAGREGPMHRCVCGGSEQGPLCLFECLDLTATWCGGCSRRAIALACLRCDGCEAQSQRAHALWPMGVSIVSAIDVSPERRTWLCSRGSPCRLDLPAPAFPSRWAPLWRPRGLFCLLERCGNRLPSGGRRL